MPALPTQVKIGGKSFSVKERSNLRQDGRDMLGLMSSFRQEILILKKFAEEQRKASILLHEIIHGINEHMDVLQGQEETEAEEKMVTQLTNGLCMVFRDNPDLVRYLSEVYV